MKKTLLLTILILLTILTACHKDQPEMNSNVTNPCNVVNEVNAEFTMAEKTSLLLNYSENQFTITDTIYGGKSVRFTALEKNADYTWYIGNEIIHEQEFVRNFDVSLVGQTLPMHLVVKKEPNLKCFPMDDGYDSITKYLTIVEATDAFNGNFHFNGTYRVKDSSMTDSIDITIFFEDLYPNPNYPNYLSNRIIVTNIGDENKTFIFQAIGFNYRQVWFGSSGFVQYGYMYNDVNGIFNLKTFGYVNSETKPYKAFNYYGRKIN